MNPCERLESNVAAYLAGTLSPTASEALEAHAAECTRCGPVLEACTRLPFAFSPAVAPPAALRAQLVHSVAQPELVPAGMVPLNRRPARWTPRRVVLPAAAAAVLLAWAVVRSGNGSPAHEPVPESVMAMATITSLALAEDRAVPEFLALAAARADVARAIDAAAPNDRLPLEETLRRIDAQHEQLRALVQEFSQ